MGKADMVRIAILLMCILLVAAFFAIRQYRLMKIIRKHKNKLSKIIERKENGSNN